MKKYYKPMWSLTPEEQEVMREYNRQKRKRHYEKNKETWQKLYYDHDLKYHLVEDREKLKDKDIIIELINKLNALE